MTPLIILGSLVSLSQAYTQSAWTGWIVFILGYLILKYEEVYCGPASEPAVISNKSDEDLISIWLTPRVSLSIGS